jgi:hypothetical protein
LHYRNGSGIPDEYADLFKACNSDTANYCYVDLLVQQNPSGSYSAYASCNAYDAAGEPGVSCGLCIICLMFVDRQLWLALGGLPVVN